MYMYCTCAGHLKQTTPRVGIPIGFVFTFVHIFAPPFFFSPFFFFVTPSPLLVHIHIHIYIHIRFDSHIPFVSGTYCTHVQYLPTFVAEHILLLFGFLLLLLEIHLIHLFLLPTSKQSHPSSPLSTVLSTYWLQYYISLCRYPYTPTRSLNQK
ncbi:hypothetical protein VTN96DRAFT_3559 [Rasamsonia emersonii]